MNKIQCPHCKEYKLRSAKVLGVTFVLVGLATLVLLIGIVLLPMGIIDLIMPTQYECLTCGYKFKNTDTQPTLKICAGQTMAKESPKTIKEHYRFMLAASKRDLSSYKRSGVVSGKYWVTGKEPEVCEVCKAK